MPGNGRGGRREGAGRPPGSLNRITRDLNTEFAAAFGNEEEFQRLMQRTKDIIYHGDEKNSTTMLRYVFDRLMGRLPDSVNIVTNGPLDIRDLLAQQKD